MSVVRLSRNLLRRVGVEVDPSATHRSLAGGSVSGGEPLFQEVLAVYKGNMRAVLALGESYGFKSLFYWQPTVFGKRSPTVYEQKVQREIADLQPCCQELCRLVQQGELPGDPGGVFHDMSEVFSHVQKPVFIDWCHISEWGNEQIAGRMASDTMRLLDADAPVASHASE